MREYPRFRLTRQASLALLVSSAFCGAAVAAPAARVDFTIGGVNATGADGKQRPIARGAVLEPGEMVTTAANGRAQLRFTDGGYTSLQPDTQFRIDDYRYDGVTDGQEKGFFSLLKGGLRTITGAIGRNNKSTYRVTTATATIGIRGTEYLARVTNSLELSVGGGTAEVRTQEPTPRVFLIPESSSIFLAGPAAPLQFIETGLFLPPAAAAVQAKQGSQPPSAPGQSDSQQTTSQTVLPPTLGLSDLSPIIPPPGGPSFDARPGFSPGPQDGIAAISATAAAHSPGTSVTTHTAECDTINCSSAVGQFATFDSTGYKRLDCSGGCFIDRNAATNTEVGSVPGVIEWGKWVGGPITAGGFYNGLTFGANQGFHYVVGVPTSPMPSTGTGSFSLLGATNPTFSDGNGGGLGTGSMTAGTATVNFSTGSITGSMTLAFTNGAYSLALTNGNFTPGTAGLSGNGTLNFNSGSVNVCSSLGCNTNVVGFFAGPNATHMGIVYDALSRTSNVFSINGGAVLKR